MRKWVANVGLEIHAQTWTKSKLFSGASTEFGGAPNSQVSNFDVAFPGTLPRLNKRCVELGVLTSLALKCKLNYRSRFDRKHYFYADLPAGFQITQQESPLARNGYLDYIVSNMEYNRVFEQAFMKRTTILQVQLEQDSGRSFHDVDNATTLIDLNRAGVGLLEIITEPNISNGREAMSLVRHLAAILTQLKVCSGQMEKGHLRVDANVSIRRENEETLGIRSEVKNINSFAQIKQAIDFEIVRHIHEKDSGREIVNETRYFDHHSGRTISMRDKEILQDYRFLPEPNLPPLVLFDSQNNLPPWAHANACLNVDDIKTNLGDPLARRIHFLTSEYALSLGQVAFVMGDDHFSQYFESCMTCTCNKKCASILCQLLIDYRKFLVNKTDVDKLEDSHIIPGDLVQIAELLYDGKISEDTAAVSYMKCHRRFAGTPLDYINSNSLWIIEDMQEAKKLAQELVYNKAPKLITNARNGGTNARKNLIKIVRNSTKGRINSDRIEGFIDEIINEQ